VNPLNTWMSWNWVGDNMLTIALIFSGSSSLPSLEIVNPRIILKKTKKIHFFKLMLMPNTSHISKHFHNFKRWDSMSLNMIKSSKKIFMEKLKYFQQYLANYLLICWWNILKTKGMATHMNAPPSIMNVTL